MRRTLLVAALTGAFALAAILALKPSPSPAGPEKGGAGNASPAPAASAQLPVAFFQTGVPDFYVRLGGRLVTNAFVSSAGGRTFWEPHAMIHPSAADWPDGEIDLLGPGW